MKLKWYVYLICAVIITVAIFCGLQMFEMFNVKNGVYGEPSTIEQQQGYEEVVRYDFGLLVLEDDNEDTYYNYYQSYAPVDFNGNLNTYSMYFNSQPVQNIEQTSGSLSGDITFTFYNTEGNQISTARLYIRIAFYEGATQVRLDMRDLNNAVSYFTTYMNYNGAVLKVLIEGETV